MAHSSYCSFSDTIYSGSTCLYALYPPCLHKLNLLLATFGCELSPHYQSKHNSYCQNIKIIIDDIREFVEEGGAVLRSTSHLFAAWCLTSKDWIRIGVYVVKKWVKCSEKHSTDVYLFSLYLACCLKKIHVYNPC